MKRQLYKIIMQIMQLCHEKKRTKIENNYIQFEHNLLNFASLLQSKYSFYRELYVKEGNWLRITFDGLEEGGWSGIYLMFDWLLWGKIVLFLWSAKIKYGSWVMAICNYKEYHCIGYPYTPYISIGALSVFQNQQSVSWEYS